MLAPCALPLALAALAWAAAPSGDVPAPPPAAPAITVVQLRPRAAVRGTEFVLADVADLTGPGAATLGALAIGYSPIPGSERRLLAATVDAKLAAAGIERAEYRLVGAGTLVAVETRPVDAAEVSRVALDSVRAGLTAGATVEIAGGVAPLEVPLPRREEGAIVLEATPRTKTLRGTFLVDVLARSGPERLASCTVPVRVKVELRVLVATAAVAAGDPADAAGIAAEVRDMTDFVGEAVSDPELLRGRILARPVAKGAILVAADLTRAPVFRKGEQSRLVIVRGALRIEANVRLESDATIGARVPAVCLETGKTILAQVREDGTLGLASDVSKENR